MGSYCVTKGAQAVLCDDPERWDGEGREGQQGGDRWTLRADFVLSYSRNRRDGHEFGQALGVADGQGSLACCSPLGHKESATTERLN